MIPVPVTAKLTVSLLKTALDAVAVTVICVVPVSEPVLELMDK